MFSHIYLRFSQFQQDSVRILLLQFSALLVEHAGAHIHDAANRKQGNKLKRLYIFAWPCLLSKQCVDPATKYHGFFLQAHIIIKFAIHKKFVLQVCLCDKKDEFFFLEI